jgi:hypothetical protein
LRLTSWIQAQSLHDGAQAATSVHVSWTWHPFVHSSNVGRLHAAHRSLNPSEWFIAGDWLLAVKNSLNSFPHPQSKINMRLLSLSQRSNAPAIQIKEGSFRCVYDNRMKAYDCRFVSAGVRQKQTVESLYE